MRGKEERKQVRRQMNNKKKKTGESVCTHSKLKKEGKTLGQREGQRAWRVSPFIFAASDTGLLYHALGISNLTTAG